MNSANGKILTWCVSCDVVWSDSPVGSADVQYSWHSEHGASNVG